jgi:hypothetical protein
LKPTVNDVAVNNIRSEPGRRGVTGFEQTNVKAGRRGHLSRP